MKIKEVLKAGNWGSKEAVNYEDFNIAVPSEKVAYLMLYNILRLRGKKVLDFGCFQGNSTYMVHKMGADYVLCAELYKKNTDQAKRKYKRHRSLDFKHVKRWDHISAKSKMDVCTMTFVHPTIKKRKELDFAFKKTARVLKRGGQIGLLGLNPNAFDNEFDFNDRNFNKESKELKNLKDGDKFQNTLYLKSGESLHLEDIFWTEETLTNLLEKNGFKVEKVLELNKNNLDRKKDKEKFDFLKKSIGKETKTKWKDEWKAPLYQIIIATKK